MTDAQPPKRKFWQMHLSTAVVLMLLAAASMRLLGPLLIEWWYVDVLNDGSMDSEAPRGFTTFVTVAVLLVWGLLMLLAYIVLEHVIFHRESKP
jgi:hypothetical protein